MIKFSNQENIDQIQILYLKGGPWLFDFHCCCFPENYNFCKTNICLISYRIGHAIYVITTSYYKSETLKCDSFENHVFNIEKGVLKCVFFNDNYIWMNTKLDNYYEWKYQYELLWTSSKCN